MIYVNKIKPGIGSNELVPGIFLFISYVDGTTKRSTAEDWVNLPSEGINYIIIDNIRICCASLYWLYPEDDHYVVGWGSVRYDPNPLTEIELYGGLQKERQIEYMPDLKISQIKLGYWWLNQPRPVIDNG